MENLYSVDEAAQKLGGISKWTIHAWLSQGRLQRTKVGGRTMIRESPVGVEKVFFAPECRQMSQDLMTGNVSEIETAVYRAS
jgi:excisionase family DNA binding protein